MRFRDVAVEAGLHFRWMLPKEPLTILTNLGAGCAFFDYDRDGWQDILLIGEGRVALFHSLGNGKFEDVTEATGLNPKRNGATVAWKGCAVGDYDADGWPDLYLSAYQDAALLHNEAGKRWGERTHEAGVKSKAWGTSAGFSDLDLDGDLDLCVSNYLEFGPHSQKYCRAANGVQISCSPSSYPTQKGHLYRNDSGGHFTNITKEAGLEAAHGGALALSFCDYNQDGRPDFYFANDERAGDLFQNLGDLKFRNVGVTNGVAYDAFGKAPAGMCADFADYDRDGYQDLVVSNFSGEGYGVYRNIQGVTFAHESQRLGVTDLTLPLLGFGGRFVDLDNDGWEDLIFANGHVFEAVEKIQPGVAFRQPLLLLRNEKGQTFRSQGAVAGEPFTRRLLGRSLATGDYDNDGRADLLVTDMDGSPLLLHNEAPQAGHWISLVLEGLPGNPDAYGTRVTVRAGGARSIREVTPVASYLSSSDPRPHFGLGSASRAEEIEIRWPDGKVERHRNVQADRFWLARRGRPLAEWTPSRPTSAPVARAGRSQRLTVARTGSVTRR